MSSRLSNSKAARANGAKSRGPATPEGRAKSSRNSLRHGLSAKTVVLPAESREQFQLLLDAHIQQFHPANPVEMDLVEAMAVARWRLRRIWAIETSLLAHELERRAEDMDEEFTEMSAEDRLAWVFQRVADNNQSLSLLARYEGNLNRAFDRAFKQLNLLKSQRQNEPKLEPSPLRPHECSTLAKAASQRRTVMRSLIRNTSLFAAGIVVGSIPDAARRSSTRSKSTGLRLSHVGIYAKDYDESMRFYTQTMGLKEAFTIKDAAGKPTLSYLQITKDTFLEIAPATGDRAVGLSHIGIWPENLAATVALLRQRGVQGRRSAHRFDPHQHHQRRPIPTAFGLSCSTSCPARFRRKRWTIGSETHLRIGCGCGGRTNARGGLSIALRDLPQRRQRPGCATAREPA